MPELIGLDFETYATVDLPVHGLDRYINDPFFTPTLASTYDEDQYGKPRRSRLDFALCDYDQQKYRLFDELNGKTIVAHNAPFEQAVLKRMGLDLPHSRFIDSAVVARAAGAGGSLEHAAPQLLGVDKLAGRNYFPLFAMPNKYQEANGSGQFDPDVVRHNLAEWEEYGEYCDRDAELGFKIVDNWSGWLSDLEHANAAITHDMNDVGWKVDMPLVHEMLRRFEENKELTLHRFRQRYEKHVDEKDQLNFRSFPQLKKFCADRGVKASSFDEEHVAKLLARVTERIDSGIVKDPVKLAQLEEVEGMLTTKQVLGGSSLSKLQKIIDLVGPGDRLRGSYLHVGAGATLRTSGRGVQMQNLKRLGDPSNMDELLEDTYLEWDNDELARNIRQLFTASDPGGFLIVGDFASVESRGLAYLAGAEWKLNAFRKGKDMYKVLAEQIFHISYDDVLKDQRQLGKVGELSCGYGAGGQAVKDFASKMGTQLDLGEATQLVNDWRFVNPEVQELWDKLNDGLNKCVREKVFHVSVPIGNKMVVTFTHSSTPKTLRAMDSQAQTVVMALHAPNGDRFLSRVFHGCYVRGKDIGYYKPSKNKTGDLWKNHYTHPKTKQVVFYKLYGGKLSGILTQSMCREMFFHSLRVLRSNLASASNVKIVGQFHDEIVLDWKPFQPGTLTDVSLTTARIILQGAMSDVGPLKGFPLVAEIKHDYRYTK